MIRKVVLVAANNIIKWECAYVSACVFVCACVSLRVCLCVCVAYAPLHNNPSMD